MTRTPPPDATSVLRAMEGYFSEDPISGPARAALVEWGESALPHLVRIAREPHDPNLDYAIVFSITHVATAQACDFFVEMLRGETGVRVDRALRALPVLLRRSEARNRLEALPEFKAALFGLAADASPSERALVAQTAAGFGWSLPIAPDSTSRRDTGVSIAEQDSLMGSLAPPPSA